MKKDAYELIRDYTAKILEDDDISSTTIQVTCQVLTPEEAIGNTGRDDFPLRKGKEKLINTVFRGCVGQAYTDMPGNLQGTVRNILGSTPADNFQRAVYIAALNAVMRYRNQIARTIHCKNEGPGECSKKLAAEIAEKYGKPKIALAGLQPAILESLAAHFPVRVFDLDPDNIGKERFGVIIEKGEDHIAEAEKWCDLFLATGSMIVNGTINPYLNLSKPVIFYGTSIAGAAEILGLERFCPMAE